MGSVACTPESSFLRGRTPDAAMKRSCAPVPRSVHRQRTAASARPVSMEGSGSGMPRTQAASAGRCASRAFLVLFAAGLCSGAAADTIVVPPGMYHADHQLHLLVVNLSAEEVNAQWPQLKTAVHAGEVYTLQPGVAQVS